jgi:hypothetical protein
MKRLVIVVLTPIKSFKIISGRSGSLADILSYAAMNDPELAAAIAEAAIELECYHQAEHCSEIMKRIIRLSRNRSA